MANTYDRLSIPSMHNGVIVRVLPIDQGREIVVLTSDTGAHYEWAIIRGTDQLDTSDEGFGSAIAALHAAKDRIESPAQ
jgi:hypothetical protein